MLYALLSLTVVRMVPVVVALARTDARMPTVAFIGWFGPRGLASVVFGLLALEDGVPEAQTLLATVVATVGLSVFLHGLTSVPLVAAYHRWYAAHAEAHPQRDRGVADARAASATPGRPGREGADAGRGRRQPGCCELKAWTSMPLSSRSALVPRMIGGGG